MNKIEKKYFKLIIIVFGLLLFGCKQADSQSISVLDEKSSDIRNDKEEIRNLIRQVYKWQERQEPTNDMIADENDSIYLGYNLDQLKLSINGLKATHLFSKEFIENYNKIYLTLDKKLRNKEMEWLVGDQPPFGNGANPWCNCQDVPYDKPNPWDLIEIESIKLDNDKGELAWKWGNVESSEAGNWNEFNYKFRVVKENEKWKISYLEGFDFDLFTRKNY